MRFLLDTNVWIQFLKNPKSRLGQTIDDHKISELATCSIVRAELLHGAKKYGNARTRTELIRSTLSPFTSLPFDDNAADFYATIRHDLQTCGLVIGPSDLQIAAIYLANDLTLVTSNVGEFSRVANLRIEDWTTSKP